MIWVSNHAYFCVEPGKSCATTAIQEWTKESSWPISEISAGCHINKILLIKKKVCFKSNLWSNLWFTNLLCGVKTCWFLWHWCIHLWIGQGISTKTLFHFWKWEEPVPGNEVGQEIPGAPVSGTWTLELCSQVDSIFPSPAEMEKQIGYSPVRRSNLHISFFTKLSRKAWQHVLTFILKIYEKIALKHSSYLCPFMWASCGLTFLQRKKVK